MSEQKGKPCKHIYHKPTCRICHLYRHDLKYRQHWGGNADVKPEPENHPWKNQQPSTPATAAPQKEKVPTCIHLGDDTGERVECPTCRGTVLLKLLNCGVYGKCTVGKPVAGVQCCAPMGQCPGYQAEGTPLVSPSTDSTRLEASVSLPPLAKPVKWAYGVTAVPQRLQDGLLSRTLKSLAAGGFPEPHVFVDGDWNAQKWSEELGVTVTCRGTSNIKTFGNWVLGMWELYLRTPDAHLYAMFQDDMVMVANARDYLERTCTKFKECYFNLYTFPENEKVHHERTKGELPVGWFQSNQLGKGAVGLVMSRDALTTLLGHPHMVTRPIAGKKGQKSVDGGIVTAFRKAGWSEMCHYPSIIQHTGDRSSMGNKRHPEAPSFPGEQTDARTWLGE